MVDHGKLPVKETTEFVRSQLRGRERCSRQRNSRGKAPEFGGSWHITGARGSSFASETGELD